MSEWNELVQGVASLVDKVGAATAVILFIWFTENRKKQKFEWSDGRMRKYIDKQTEELTEHVDKRLDEMTPRCLFTVEEREFLKCLHDTSAREAIARNEVISAADDATVAVSQLIKEIKRKDS